MPTWNQFAGKIHVNAFRLPIPPVASTANRVRTSTAQGAGVGLTLVDGLGPNLARVHPAVGVIAGVAGASDVEGAVGSLGENALTTLMSRDAALGAEGGLVFAGLIMILNGAAQALDRHEQVMRYTMGTLGYVSTLARACELWDQNQSQLRFATPLVPAYISGRGVVASGNRERKFRAGSDRMKQILRAYDRSAPAGIGLTPAKAGIAELIRRSNGTGRRNLRADCEDYIYKHILKVNRNQVAERLQRWANS